MIRCKGQTRARLQLQNFETITKIRNQDSQVTPTLNRESYAWELRNTEKIKPVTPLSFTHPSHLPDVSCIAARVQ
jgi:hypothetical protein